MRKILIYSLVFFLLLVPTLAISQNARFSKRVSWNEKFSGNGPVDARYWTMYKDYYPTGEASFTDSVEHVYVKGGRLHIMASLGSKDGKACTSGYIHTKNKVSFLYGKILVKAKVPTGEGIFPAIWMLRQDHGTVFPLGEIDIMEYVECFDKKEFCTTIHLVHRPNGYDGEKIEYKHSKKMKADMSKYHIYGLEWTPERLTFTLDGKAYYTLVKSEAEYWPFDYPHYLIIDLGYGSWGFQCGRDDSILPKEMLVDWIKYYKLID